MLIFVFCFILSIIGPGSCQKVMKGKVWPEPQGQRLHDEYFSFSPQLFEFKIANITCSILNDAILRYQQVLKELYAVMVKNNVNHASVPGNRSVLPFSKYQGNITDLQLELKQPCEDEYPHFRMDESYYLEVRSSSKLSADTIWGMLRGLETFSQLFYIVDDCSEIQIRSTDIFDFPHYFHRGLLLDTARHYISVPSLLQTLDAMAMNKLNVFHWHITDDESFPYQSDVFPELSEKGAFHPSMVYTQAQMKEIVKYARYRGIRVIPEIDIPGHTGSLFPSHKELLTQCMKLDDTSLQATPVGLGPLHPLKRGVFKLLLNLYKEMQGVFSDEYLHIGGDDVDLECWASNPAIQEILMKYKIPGAQGLFALFEKKIIKLLKAGTKPIVWEEVFLLGTDIPEDTLVQAFSSDEETIASMLKGGVKVIKSTGWDLDDANNDFEAVYHREPRLQLEATFTVGNQTLDNIVGGEACAWGLNTDDSNLHNRLWPRASAVAEVLWSVTRGRPSESTLRRAQAQSCRMRRRGVPAETAAGPGVCFT